MTVYEQYTIVTDGVNKVWSSATCTGADNNNRTTKRQNAE